MMASMDQAQWGKEESRELIMIGGETEREWSGIKTKGKSFWETVSSKMRDRGYSRTPDQCKCNWNNLVNRYKGKETSDLEIDKDFLFSSELHEAFNERAKNMQRMVIKSEAGSSQGKKMVKRMSESRSSSDGVDENEECGSDGEEKLVKSSSRKRKVVEKSSRIGKNNSIEEMLKEFVKQQQRMEMEWREMMEKRALQRELFEEEWRLSMEKLERDRLMVEQAWREKEEQRRIRDEIRAEKRDALLTTLLTKLINDR